MKLGTIVGFGLLTACISNQPNRDLGAKRNDSFNNNPYSINGLWQESKQKYESSFVFIQNDTVYFLKGHAEQYYIDRDTLYLTSGGRFQRKIIEVDSVRLKWETNSGETFILYKKLN